MVDPSTQIATLQQQVAEATAAYHQLMIGQSLVRIRHNAREMSYSQANAADLLAYISTLNAQLAQLGVRTVGPRRGRSRRVIF
jgi:hypothetical protein